MHTINAEHWDLAVIGGGSGGCAAALAAARRGMRVVVVEAMDMLGGTATAGGVNCWEMGTGGTGIPFDIYRRLHRDCPDAVGIYSCGRHFCRGTSAYWPHEPRRVDFPGGENVIDPTRSYADTLRRHPPPALPPAELQDWKDEHWHGVVFLPEPMAATLTTLLTETGCVTQLLASRAVAAKGTDGRVSSVTLADGSRISAEYWVDGAAGVLCRLLGCETPCGIDPQARFGEPGAPADARAQVNAVTLVYRVHPVGAPAVESLPAAIPAECWWAPHFPPMQCVNGPDGSRNCNMLPTMSGSEFLRLGYDAAYTECDRRIRAHWHYVQTHWPEFRGFRLAWVAPLLGIREHYRVVGEKMLTEPDVQAGLSGQHDADIIAVADHALDRHGEGGGCPELREPYGIPYRCLIPRGWRNLLVACRAAGFSSIAASSCRLTRTMMQLGQAAGNAAAIAANRGCDLPDIPPATLRQTLRDQHVQLEWPPRADVLEHVRKDSP